MLYVCFSKYICPHPSATYKSTPLPLFGTVAPALLKVVNVVKFKHVVVGDVPVHMSCVFENVVLNKELEIEGIYVDGKISRRGIN